MNAEKIRLSAFTRSMTRNIHVLVPAGLLLGWTAAAQVSAPKSAMDSATPGRLAAQVAGVTTNDYVLSEVGTLHLEVPVDWNGSFRKTIVMGTRADEFQFQPRTGGGFAAMVVAVHMNPASARDFNTKEVLAEAAQKELPDSAEKTLDIHALAGPEVKGHYLSLTDATMSATDAKPGQYKYVTTAYGKLRDVVLILRLGSNRNGDEKAQAIELIQTARLTPPK